VSEADSSMILSAQGLCKSFRFGEQRIEVLRGVDLELAEASSLSIRGDSGCGKTTLLNLLARLETASEGKIQWKELSLDASTKASTQEIRLRANFLGVVYQAYYLIPELNVLENVLIGASLAGRNRIESKNRARYLLSKMGVEEKQTQIPQKLSGGERQRVAIARALINQPKVVLADEPTGNLDERTGGEVMDLLLESCQQEKSSLLLVTHNRTFAEATDQQAFLQDGSLNPL